MGSTMNQMAAWLASVGPHVPSSRSNLSNNNNNGPPIYSMAGPNGFEVFIPSGTHPPPVQQSGLASPGYIQRDGRAYRNNFGNYRPLLRGRVVLGPEWKLFLVHWFGFVIVLILLLLEHKDIERLYGRWTMFVGLGLHMVSISLFTYISFTDPGVVPLNYTMSELIAETEGYRERNPGQRFYRYCIKCQGFRPPLCFHCNSCNICIRSQEMHMIAGGICIGDRTARSFLLMTLLMGALSWYLVIINSLLIAEFRAHSTETNEGMDMKKLILAILSGISGIVLLCLPQLGVLMFMFRLYYIGNGYTTRSFINAMRPDEMACPEDKRKMCQNYMTFFCGKRKSSVFRKRFNQVQPEYGALEDQWIGTSFLDSRDSRDLIHLIRGNDRILDDNANLLHPTGLIGIEAEEAILLRALAADARHKTTPSVPQLDNGGLEQIPGSSRLKTPFKSKPCEMLQLRINQFQKAQGLPKSTISYRKHHEAPSTLSEGCIPREINGGQELIQVARAEQFRRIIQLVLLRDREGLIRMSRRINIAGLLGIDYFDPDNLQFVELSNGLPMLAPRRRDVGGPQNVHRFGGLLGIPQMVAAGLLPTARQMATDVESRLGPGSVIRVANPPLTNAIRGPRNNDQAQVQAHMTIAAGNFDQLSRHPNLPPPVSSNMNPQERISRVVLAQRRLQRAAMQRANSSITPTSSSAFGGSQIPVISNNNTAAVSLNQQLSNIPVAPRYYPQHTTPTSHHRIRGRAIPRPNTESFGNAMGAMLTEFQGSGRQGASFQGPNPTRLPGTLNDDEQQLLVLLNDGNAFRPQLDRRDGN